MGHILIIDDSDTLRSQLRSLLTSAGHRVSEAIDGNDGLEKLTTKNDFNLVIADYNMPGLDGLTMLAEAKAAMGGKFNFPVFVLTTEGSLELKNKGLELGVLAWIVKPFNGPKLIKAIKEIITTH